MKLKIKTPGCLSSGCGEVTVTRRRGGDGFLLGVSDIEAGIYGESRIGAVVPLTDAQARKIAEALIR